MRKIAVVTVARSDYGILRPVMRAIQARRDLELFVVAAGEHLVGGTKTCSRRFASEGFAPSAMVTCSPSSDSPVATSVAMGEALAGFARAWTVIRPDIVLLPGDRFETHAAATSALPFCIPVAHIHGGEVSTGAMDNQFRHSISKMSHIHFVATELSSRHLISMGEEPRRVFVTGAPGLDNLKAVKTLSRAECDARLDLPPGADFILATFHPATLDKQNPAYQLSELLNALSRTGKHIVFTAPNADPGSRQIKVGIRKYVSGQPDARYVDNMGTTLYLSAMKYALCMAGNSSSGIIEAASCGLPVVNVGDRQGGREHGSNVIDVPCRANAILTGLKEAMSAGFRASARRVRNPYGDGKAAGRIASRLARIGLDESLVRKGFYAGGNSECAG